MSSPTPDIKTSSLSDHGIKYLTGEIDDSTCKPIIEWIIEESLRARFDRLTLIVSSYGGDLFAAFGLIDAIQGSRIPVDTIGLGYIASAGLLIFMHGAHRTLTPNTYIMSHQYSTGTYGKHHELVANRKAEDWIAERLLTMYQDQSKLSRAQINSFLLGPSDTFINAREALRCGLTDSVKEMKPVEQRTKSKTTRQ